MWQGVPFLRTLTLLTLGFQVLFVFLFEWDTLIPKVTPFPQTSHFAMGLHLLIICSEFNKLYHTKLFGQLQVFFENFFENLKLILKSAQIT